jgi:hypothetical protein
MFRKAQACGLPITDADIAALEPEVTDPKPTRRLTVGMRVVSSTDRRHYTVTPAADWTNPPDTCPVEGEADEGTASAIGERGIELLPLDVRRRMAAIYEAADQVARQREYTVDHVREWLLTLIEARVILVTNEAQLAQARQNMGVLIATAADHAKRRDYRVLEEFFMNEALLGLPHLYPWRD